MYFGFLGTLLFNFLCKTLGNFNFLLHQTFLVMDTVFLYIEAVKYCR